MNAAAIIEKIKQLPREEQAQVLRFALQLAGQHQRSGGSLSELARRMTHAVIPEKAQAMRDKIHRGFYGE